MRVSAALVALIATALVLFGGASSSAASAASPQYANPVFAGAHPDPSVLRVGDVFWATSTSNQFAPLFPLMKSTDLVNWRLVGSIFPRPPAWSDGRYWAPELARMGGRFVVFYSARKRGGALCVASAVASRPQGPWTDRGPLVCQPVGSLDAFPIKDENGRWQLLWKEERNAVGESTPIWAAPLSGDGGRIIGPQRELIRNEASWEGQLVEGPAVVRRAGWFYLFYSAGDCCTSECDYRVGVARSRTLTGRWRKNPANPVLVGSERFQCPGHGTVLEHGGRYYFLYHAVRDPVVGREMLLDRVRFTRGWPAIGTGRPSEAAPSPLGARQRPLARSLRDEFASLSPRWGWPLDADPQTVIDPLGGGGVVLRANGGAALLDSGVLATRTLTANWTATAATDPGTLGPGAHSGVAATRLLRDQREGVGVAVGDGRVVMWVHRETGPELVVGARQLNTRGPVELELSRRGTSFTARFRPVGGAWTRLGEAIDGSFLASMRIGLTVGGVAGATARFERFTLVPSG